LYRKLREKHREREREKKIKYIEGSCCELYRKLREKHTEREREREREKLNLLRVLVVNCIES
jgi:hypothetical protein